MTRVTKPMLAATYGTDKGDVRELAFPYLASPKIDGVRMLVVDGVCQSRSGKPIPNPTVQHLFGRPEFEGWDGELAIGSLTAKNLMQRTMKVMSKDELKGYDLYMLSWNVFDVWDLSHNYASRFYSLKYLHGRLQMGGPAALANVHVVPHTLIECLPTLDAYEAACLAEGYEGVMLNLPDGKYKHGRAGCTKKSELIKIKRFRDDEAVVVGTEEMMHNDNVDFKDELGRTKRATLQENMRPAGVLGALRLRVTTGTFTGAEFTCSGFTAQQRADLWRERDGLIGKLVTFKHFNVTGAKDKPRQPVFKGFRSELDTSAGEAVKFGMPVRSE